MKPAARRVVLVGGGHAHAQVLADWTRRPVEGVELWLVSPESRSPYSGMVPGWLAGLYRYDEICIDIAALCARAMAVFIEDEATGIDPVRRSLTLRGGTSIDYDLLSLDVGSTLRPPVSIEGIVLPLRPLSKLRERWSALVDELSNDAADAPLTLVGVGGGAAGFESLLALQARIAKARPQRPIEASLISRSATLLPGLARGAVRRAARTLAGRGIALRTDFAFDAAATRSGDVLLWATGARPHEWPATCGLAIDTDGYIAVDRHLRSLSHPDVFASGDCAAWHRPLPKAGVYAVRMGPVLVRNLRAALGHGRMRSFRPQRRHLVLLSTADRRAIASWGPLSASGAWVWRWKDHVDRRFVARFGGRTKDPVVPRLRPHP